MLLESPLRQTGARAPKVSARPPWHLGHNEIGQSNLQFVPADFCDIASCGGDGA
jgi:hypothetical protein